MKRILVTGGAGFIGSNLIAYINSRNPEVQVVVADDLSTGKLDNLLGLKFELHQISVLDRKGLAKAARGADSIVHLAALGSVPRSVANPVATHEANVTGTLNVLEAAREHGVEHTTVASSSSVYGGNLAQPKHERDWTMPLSPYAASKLSAESYALSYQASYGLKVLAFRFFNVYGPKQSAGHDYAAVIPRFIDAALTGKPLTVYGDGMQSRDFTYVETVCSAIHSALIERVAHPHPVNLAFGTSTTLLELIALLRKKLDRHLEVVFEPRRTGDVRASRADSTTIEKMFSSIRPADLETGLAQTINWFEEAAGL